MASNKAIEERVQALEAELLASYFLGGTPTQSRGRATPFLDFREVISD